MGICTKGVAETLGRDSCCGDEETVDGEGGEVEGWVVTGYEVDVEYDGKEGWFFDGGIAYYSEEVFLYGYRW